MVIVFIRWISGQLTIFGPVEMDCVKDFGRSWTLEMPLDHYKYVWAGAAIDQTDNLAFGCFIDGCIPLGNKLSKSEGIWMKVLGRFCKSDVRNTCLVWHELGFIFNGSYLQISRSDCFILLIHSVQFPMKRSIDRSIRVNVHSPLKSSHVRPNRRRSRYSVSWFFHTWSRGHIHLSTTGPC